MIAAAIETERLVLAPLEVGDAGEMVGVLSDPSLYAFTGGKQPSLDELTAQYRVQVAGSGRDSEVWLNWIVRLGEGGTAVGFVQATVTNDGADMAWVIGADWQRQGFAVEAAAAMKKWLDESGVELCAAHIARDHAASQRVAAAIGLTATGRLDDEGEEVWDSRPPDGYGGRPLVV